MTRRREVRTAGVEPAPPRRTGAGASRPGRQWIPGGARFRSTVRALLVPLVILAVWFAVTNAGWVGKEFLPTPQRLFGVLTTGYHHLAGQRVPFAEGLPGATWISLRMVLLGLAVGAPPGLAVGLAFGYSRWARELLEFSLDAIRPTPLFATIPLFLVWFGSSMRSQVALIAFGVFLILTIQTTEAVRNVPHIYIRAALTAGASRFHIYRTVVIPAILPHMIAGFRLAVVVAWSLDVAAEFMGTQQGLGYLMISRQRYLDNAGILVLVFMFAVLAILSDFLLRAVAKRYTRWSPRGASPGLVGEMLGSR